VSKSLTECQQDYDQIELRGIARDYLWMSKISSIFIGKRFVIETDHKPLETIFKKSFSKCPLRLQRLRITLQNYDIEVRYKPRKHLYHILLMLSHYKDCIINESDIQVLYK